MGNLIPCPYCKNKNVTVGGWPLEYVSCKCGVKGPDSSSRAEAIIGWNKMAGLADTKKSLALVTEERKRQFELYGDQSGKSPYEFLAILGEEYGELCEAVTETFMVGRHPERGGKENIIKEAVHVAAVAVQLIEVLLRTTDPLYEHHGNLIDRDCISNQILDKWGCDPMYYANDPKCGEEARADAYVLATLAQAKIVIPAEGGHDNA